MNSNKNNFIERLTNYRNHLGFSKREFAEKLDMSESYYNMIENGKRNPPKKFLYKLSVFSEKPEEYWLFGVVNDSYVVGREDLKSIKDTIEFIMEHDLIDDIDSILSVNPTDNVVEKLLKKAIKSDLSYILNKNNSNL